MREWTADDDKRALAELIIADMKKRKIWPYNFDANP